MRPPRRLVRKLLIAGASVALAFAATELVLRAAEPGPFSFVDRRPYEDSPVDGFVRHVPGFEGRWDATWYSIDSRGLRGPERVPTFAEGELRIACVGDSCTFGKGVLEEQSWPRQLETLLRGDGRSVEVFNLGINGAYGRVYEQRLIELADELRPDIVIVGYNLNDFPNAIRAVDEQVFRGRRARTIVPQRLRDALGRLATYRWLRQVYYDRRKASDWAAARASAREAPPVPSEVWDQQRGYLSRIQALAAKHGGEVVVLLFPYESQVYAQGFDDGPIEGLRAVCDDLGLPFLDLAAEFQAAARATEPPAQLFLAGDRYHPNAAGYSIVARRVVELLQGEGWAPGGG